MSDTNYTEVVKQAKNFTSQFGALLKAADELEAIGDLQRHKAELRAAIKKTQGELDVLRDEASRGYQKIYESIEAELKFRYSESEKLLADEVILRTTVKGLEDRRAELTAKNADLERSIGQAEGRYSDVTGKLGMLKASLDR
jgi:chromosome segregation ATPase